ncbi:MAG: SDR family oxidoreductase [Pseudomonadota bacterium]|jgi:Short-chain dehydrogenases of various substrate specificities
MNLEGCRILLTGASGGLGAAIAESLAARGARLALAGRRRDALDTVARRLRSMPAQAHVVEGDITDAAQRREMVESARAQLGGIDVLINNAGALEFTLFAEQDPATIERIVQTNLLGPMLLTREVLPHLLAQGEGRVVNIGSTFGTIGFACFTSYSASKFGLRGFSEALRRELDGSGVGVTYVAPRAARTAINNGTVMAMAREVKMNMDPPEVVAQAVVRALQQDRDEAYVGFPESFFARLNALLPRLVDRALRGQNAVMRRYAQS